MERGEVKAALGRQVEQGAKLGAFVVQRLPIVGPHVQHFLDQDKLLSRLLHHEGVKHFERIKAELAVAEACGPEQEASELRRETTLLAAEVFSDPEHAAAVLPILPEQPEE